VSRECIHGRTEKQKCKRCPAPATDPLHETRLWPADEVMTAVRIMLEGKAGAAQNAVREDYPELAEIVDSAELTRKLQAGVGL
jgi:hypothetical protein